jgi:hypothetical protein
MTPIVHGLEEEFEGAVAFVHLNAMDGADGEQAFQRLALRGHPAYVLFDIGGNELYRTFGIVEAGALHAEIAGSLGE